MHIMTDIETFGAQDDAQILQISAVAFELNETVLEPHELLQYDDRWFDAVIEPYAGKTLAGNLKFWSEAGEASGHDAHAARTRIMTQPRVSLYGALERFSAFVGHWLGKRGCMWAKPPQFDLRILRGNYVAQTSLAPPWHFSQEKDLSTLLWAARKVPRVNFRVPDMTQAGLVHHYALHDAVGQAVVAQAAYRSLAQFTAQRIADRGAMLAAQQKELSDAVEIEQGRPRQAAGDIPA
jgi:hypothetical protein